MSNDATVKEPLRHAATFVSSKITEDHLQLGAALYVRQSTSAQLREHQESTVRQYALKDRLVAFGWPDDRIIVIDDDLGIGQIISHAEMIDCRTKGYRHEYCFQKNCLAISYHKRCPPGPAKGTRKRERA